MYKNLLFFFLLILLTSCSSSYKEIKKIKIEKPNNFNEYLLNQYQKKAIFEAEEMHDWNSAKLYSEKALRSINGEIIYPENINYWKIPENKISKIIKAYDNLMAIYFQAIKIDPYNLAIAVSSLDCWAEQQEENWQTWDIIRCRDDYLESIHLIYNKISNNQLENIKKNESENKTTIFSKNTNREKIQIIYFDFDDFNLSDVSINQIKRYLNKYNNKTNKFLIIGHTDSKGSNEYNKILSLKRAETVKKILIGLGVSKSNISILGKGEELLSIKTKDEVSHPANRRAVIYQAN